MATAKKNTTKKNDEVEVLDKAPEVESKIENGIYTEKGVRLNNGTIVELDVIVDKDMLPASSASLLHEGNMEGMMMAYLTSKSRRILDMVGATRKDLNTVISEVVQRATDAAEK